MGSWDRLEATVESYKDRGILGVTVMTSAGDRWSLNGDRRFKAASIMKVPLMVEIFRQIDRNERALDDVHVLEATDKAPGSGVMLNLHDGLSLTLRDLVYLMISISDNTATNMLIRAVTMPAVNSTMRLLGMTQSNLSREMKGRPAAGDEQENWATPDDYVVAINKLLNREAASAEACDAMLQMLERQQNDRRIARLLPKDESVQWGAKAGTIEGVANDVGFVRTPAGTLVLSVFCESVQDVHLADQIIGEVSLAAMQDSGMLDSRYTTSERS